MSRCIACNCTDARACAGGCFWLRVDHLHGIGVCSNCASHVPAFDAGQAAAPAPTLVDRAVTAFFRLDPFGRALTARQIRVAPVGASQSDVRAAFARYERAGNALDLLVDEIEDEANQLNEPNEVES